MTPPSVASAGLLFSQRISIADEQVGKGRSSRSPTIDGRKTDSNPFCHRLLSEVQPFTKFLDLGPDITS